VEGAIPIGGINQDKTENSNHNLKFPWRSNASVPVDVGLVDKLRNLMAEGSFRQILRYDDISVSDDVMMSTFLQGSVVAFAASAGTIFSLTRPGAGEVISKPVEPTVSSSDTATDTTTDTTTEGDGVVETTKSTGDGVDSLNESTAASWPDCSAQYAVPDLTDIFDPKLSSFYFDAIAASKAAGLEVTYRLLSGAAKTGMESNSDDSYPITATIAKHQVLFNAKREMFAGLLGAEDKPSRELLYYLGIFPFLVGDKSNFNSFFPPTTEQEEKDPKKMVVRVWVDILVKELFHVKNKMTGAIVQGSTEPVDAVHTVLLECQVVMDHDSADRKVSMNKSDWSVVDIDNWCADNQFWR